MPDLTNDLCAFINANGWSDNSIATVAGDLSRRRYYRLSNDGRTAIVMDASADQMSVEPFMVITSWLRDARLSAPEIYAADATRGYLLLEDLGVHTAGYLMANDRDFADIYFDACIDLLLAIRAQEPLALHCPDATELARWTAVTDTNYPGVDHDAQRRYRAVLETELPAFLSDCTTSLRDFHAENLIWLPDRSGPARLGLLDYQDAFLTHPIYDLVSLLTDARTNVPRAQRSACIEAYARRSGDDPATLAAAFALFSAQRNMRILGIFAGAAQNGKPHHLPKLPRVYGYLAEALEHPVFDSVRDAVLDGLPDPQATARILAP